MKLVIFTQFRENYGAHDWDGKGECPQYWKNKGGSTYILDISIAEAQNTEFYDAVYQAIEYSSDYAHECIIGESLIDDCDFNLSDVVEKWETPTYASYNYEERRLDTWWQSSAYDEEAA
jgi:hypothetical protein